MSLCIGQQQTFCTVTSDECSLLTNVLATHHCVLCMHLPDECPRRSIASQKGSKICSKLYQLWIRILSIDTYPISSSKYPAFLRLFSNFGCGRIHSRIHCEKGDLIPLE